MHTQCFFFPLALLACRFTAGRRDPIVCRKDTTVKHSIPCQSTRSIRIALAVVLMAFGITSALSSLAHADRLVAIASQPSTVSSTTVVKKPAAKNSDVVPCRTARCEERVMAAMADMIVEAKSRPTAGPTYDNCITGHPKFVALGQRLQPQTLERFFYHNPWVGECSSVVPPREAVIQQR